MKKSGKRSAADKAAKVFARRIAPSRKLSAAEQKVWDGIVAAWPREHFIASDGDLLTTYCAVRVLLNGYERVGDLDRMDKAGRLAVTYATKLRLTPQARVNKMKAGTSATAGIENAAADSDLLGSMDEWENASMN